MAQTRPPVRYVRYPFVGNIESFATYIQGRGFKLHRSIGPAKTAITTAGHGILYRFMAGRDGDVTWTPVAVINEGEARTHPYRKMKPDQLTKAVILFVIQEIPV